MTKISNTPRTVIVTGDVTMDWALTQPEGLQSSGMKWNVEDSIRVYFKSGGAAILEFIIRGLGEELERRRQASYKVLPQKEYENVSPHDEHYHHSFSLWALHKHDEEASKGKEARAWRVKSFLGLYRSQKIAPAIRDGWKRAMENVKDAALVVIDDANLGFRRRAEVWRRALLASDATPWIILKMAWPVAEGRLWSQLSRQCPERLIVVVTVNDLRLTEVQISRELSWERTAQDLAWELVTNSNVKELSQCAHVVVSFGPAGAVLLSKSKLNEGTPAESPVRNTTLFFDPKVIEGTWGQNYPGGVIGYASSLVASLAHQVLQSPERPDLPQGIHNALAAIRRLHIEGYGLQETSKDPIPPLEFPRDAVVEEILKPRTRDVGKGKPKTSRSGSPFVEIKVKEPDRLPVNLIADSLGAENERFWSILQDSCDQSQSDDNGDLYELARDIVKFGPKTALKNVPLGRFGKLLTVDRREIESFHSVRALIKEYSAHHRPGRPLSIAVFGPPGSGKSFGVTEVANSVLRQPKKLTFNLSQFSNPKEILSALHQVRDEALGGAIPLVFWDEFDTTLNGQPLGWLRYFLAPMQDGKFQDGQITHSIGSAIFVFAGGTSSSRKDFEQKAVSEQFKDAKGRDFVSRLKGYINIMGPNCNKETPDGDPSYVIRRAILLRSLLELRAIHLFKRFDSEGELKIDLGVLSAFLTIPTYEHGARSIESIIDMSLLTDKTSFERSSLPAEAQLDLHVNGRDFLNRVQQNMLKGKEKNVMPSDGVAMRARKR